MAINVREDYSLKNLNTFGIDVSARYFIEVSNLYEINQVFEDSRFLKCSKLILGGGSNVLFTKNVDGLVIKNAIKGIELVDEDEEHYFVKANAGEVWHQLVMYCIEHNYAGLENLSLIPGCVGASPMQNIGAYGMELKDSFKELEAWNIKDKFIQKFNKDECKFGYRESVFKRELRDQYLITSVTLKLNKKPNYNINYGALEKELEAMGIQDLSISAISKAVCAIRNSKLPNPSEIGNAGSFFKNPEVKRSNLEDMKTEFPNIVGYELENGNFKLAAGWLIEQCGWKGKTIGDAGVHKLQALVLVNYANARGSELLDLSNQIIKSVNTKFGVELEREVNIY